MNKYECIAIIANKHFAKIEKKTLLTNIAGNGLYDNRLCGSNAVYGHVDRSLHCRSEVFFYLTKCWLLLLVFSYICVSKMHF